MIKNDEMKALFDRKTFQGRAWPYSDTHCLQTSLLIFKFCQPEKKESFVKVT